MVTQEEKSRDYRLGIRNAFNKIWCQSIEDAEVFLIISAGGATLKVKGSPKSVGFILLASWISAPNFTAVNQIVVEISNYKRKESLSVCPLIISIPEAKQSACSKQAHFELALQ